MEPTAIIVAVNEALVEPEATVTDVGTVTEESLLERLTAAPVDGAAPPKVTVQLSVAAPVIAALVQVKELNVTGLDPPPDDATFS